MATLNNPFVIYGYKGPEYFCDREAETEKMISALHNERNVTLVAPRRMGKTGLIKHVFAKMEKQDKEVRCFYLDIYPAKNLDQMVGMLGSEIIGKLDSVSQAAMRRVQEFFSKWRPTLTIDEVTGRPTFSLDIRPSEGRETLKQIFEYLGQSGKRCYIAIDEFQQILNFPESGVEALIRSYIQFLPNVYFVFSGSQQHMMEEMFLSANRPFFQSSSMMTLSSIDKKKYIDFANRFFEGQSRAMDEDTFEYIYDVSDKVTWYVQAILHGIYEHSKNMINRQLVNDVVREIIEDQSTAYQNYCAWLTENQQRLLAAIAKERLVSSPLGQKFIRTYNLPAVSSVKSALKALVDKQLVAKTPQGYLVSDRFFAKWLSGHIL